MREGPKTQISKRKLSVVGNLFTTKNPERTEKAPRGHSCHLAVVFLKKKWNAYPLEIRVHLKLRRTQGSEEK